MEEEELEMTEQDHKRISKLYKAIDKGQKDKEKLLNKLKAKAERKKKRYKSSKEEAKANVVALKKNPNSAYNNLNSVQEQEYVERIATGEDKKEVFKDIYPELEGKEALSKRQSLSHNKTIKKATFEMYMAYGLSRQKIANTIVEAMEATKTVQTKEGLYDSSLPDHQTRLAAARLGSDLLGDKGGGKEKGGDVHLHQHIGSDEMEDSFMEFLKSRHKKKQNRGAKAPQQKKEDEPPSSNVDVVE